MHIWGFKDNLRDHTFWTHSFRNTKDAMRSMLHRLWALEMGVVGLCWVLVQHTRYGASNGSKCKVRVFRIRMLEQTPPPPPAQALLVQLPVLGESVNLVPRAVLVHKGGEGRMRFVEMCIRGGRVWWPTTG